MVCRERRVLGFYYTFIAIMYSYVPCPLCQFFICIFIIFICIVIALHWVCDVGCVGGLIKFASNFVCFYAF